MTCVCGHASSLHVLTVSGQTGACWVTGCNCAAHRPLTLGGSGSESPDRVAPSARSTPAETTVVKPLAESVATDESPARSRTACAAGSSLLDWRDVRDAVDREIDLLPPDVSRLLHRSPSEDSARLGWLGASVSQFLNNHPEHRAELLPELDPETTETTW